MTEISQLKRLGLFDARVPRYTSYPTAPQFSDRVGGSHVAHWLEALPEGTDFSVYVHVPFCRRLCWFCACRTQGTSTLAPVAAYIETVKAELRLIASHLPEGVRIEHLHWGGGTPTLLSPDLIADLAGEIRDMAPLAPDAQFSVEIDPCEVDAARMDALVAAGMTRASLGVQDFNPLIQDTIGRPQSFEATRDAIEGLRARGVRSLNADIVYGLPHQTEPMIADSVQKLLSLNPDRVALFGYAHVPWMAKRQNLIPSTALPSAEERLDLFNTARDLFLWDGYSEIGIDHFARVGDGLETAWRTGAMRRNFQGYTEDRSDTLIGIGASAISRFREGYAQNESSTSNYQRRVRDGAIATARGHQFAGDDVLRGWVIERLLCDFAVDLDEAATATGAPKERARTLLTGLDDLFPGMTALTGDLLEILPAGRPLARMIARHFDAYAVDAAGHSPAV